jgi:hypothetical protein
MDLLVALEVLSGFTSSRFELRHLFRQNREDMAFLLFRYSVDVMPWMRKHTYNVMVHIQMRVERPSVLQEILQCQTARMKLSVCHL